MTNDSENRHLNTHADDHGTTDYDPKDIDAHHGDDTGETKLLVPVQSLYLLHQIIEILYHEKLYS